jgi:hypothetical protein
MAIVVAIATETATTAPDARTIWLGIVSQVCRETADGGGKREKRGVNGRDVIWMLSGVERELSSEQTERRQQISLLFKRYTENKCKRQSFPETRVIK